MSLGAREWLALLGPNGAGKTTLIRAIAGRVRLDRGQVTLLGETLDRDDAHRDSKARRCLGMVPQEIALYPLLSAEENLLGFAILHGVPRGELQNRVSWALEWTGLADRAKSLFLSAASHDLRQPIHALGLFLTSLETLTRALRCRWPRSTNSGGACARRWTR